MKLINKNTTQMKSITFILAVILFAAFSSAFRLHSRLDHKAELESKSKTGNVASAFWDGEDVDCGPNMAAWQANMLSYWQNNGYPNYQGEFSYYLCDQGCGFY